MASESELLNSKMLMLSNIEKLEIVIYKQEYISLIERIIEQCKYKIKWCNVRIELREQSRLKKSVSQLTLPNAQYIVINNCYHRIKWTNKCHSLHWELDYRDRIGYNENWCKYLIDNSYVVSILSILKNKMGLSFLCFLFVFLFLYFLFFCTFGGTMRINIYC